MQYWLLFGLEMLSQWGIIVAEDSSLLECYAVTTCKYFPTLFRAVVPSEHQKLFTQWQHLIPKVLNVEQPFCKSLDLARLEFCSVSADKDRFYKTAVVWEYCAFRCNKACSVCFNLSLIMYSIRWKKWKQLFRKPEELRKHMKKNGIRDWTKNSKLLKISERHVKGWRQRRVF